jgi:hypothetical protein
MFKLKKADSVCSINSNLRLGLNSSSFPIEKVLNGIICEYQHGVGSGKRMAVNLDTLIISLIVNIIVLSPVLWISGRLLAGKDKAKFTDAL